MAYCFSKRVQLSLNSNSWSADINLPQFAEHKHTIDLMDSSSDFLRPFDQTRITGLHFDQVLGSYHCCFASFRRMKCKAFRMPTSSIGKEVDSWGLISNCPSLQSSWFKGYSYRKQLNSWAKPCNSEAACFNKDLA